MLRALWHDSRLMGLLTSFFSLFALLLIATALGKWFIQLPYFQIRQVQLVGEVERVSGAGFKTAVLPRVQGSFFSINLEEAKALIEGQSWVRKAVVQRVWPNGIKVSVQSHKPLALWGETRLINTFGEVFNANPAEAGDPDQMAMLEGPPGSEFLVAKTYVAWVQELKDLELDLAGIRLSDRYGWSIKTRQGTEIQMGRDQEPQNLSAKMRRLKTVYPKIKQDMMSTVSLIDMRYPRAVAVKGDRLMPSKTDAAKLNKTP